MEKSAPEGADNDDGENSGPQASTRQDADVFLARVLTYVLALSDLHKFFRRGHGFVPPLLIITA